METELILVRHGESVPNVHPVVGGMRGDAGLTDRGHQQAELLAARWRAEQFRADVLYASTLPRAQQTAAYLSPVLDLPVVDDAELMEVRVGEADGLPNTEWAERWPGLSEGLWLRPYQPFATGGESWAMFLARAGTALNTLVERHPGERIVAVSHGGVIESSFAMALGLGPTARTQFTIANASLTSWLHDPGSSRPWCLQAFNDDRHLAA